MQVSATSKGLPSWECTVDGEGWTEAEILEYSDSLVAALQQRYPAPEAPAKEK